MATRLIGGNIHDPINGIDGRKGDLWIEGGRIVAPPADGQASEEIDVSGMVVMPGGIDLHSHAARPGPEKVGDSWGGLDYAFKDGSILGRSQCVSYNSKTTTDYLVFYARGWNFKKVELKEYVDDPLHAVYTTAQTTGPVPPELKWYPY